MLISCQVAGRVGWSGTVSLGEGSCGFKLPNVQPRTCYFFVAFHPLCNELSVLT